MASRKGIQNLNPKRRQRIDRALLRKYGQYCQWCGKWIDRTLPDNDPMCWSRDHIITVADGGSNDIENLQPMHKLCNQKRDEFLHSQDEKV